MKYQMVRAHAMILSYECCLVYNSLLHNLFARSHMSVHIRFERIYIYRNQIFNCNEFKHCHTTSITFNPEDKTRFTFYNPFNFEYDLI